MTYASESPNRRRTILCVAILVLATIMMLVFLSLVHLPILHIQFNNGCAPKRIAVSTNNGQAKVAVVCAFCVYVIDLETKKTIHELRGKYECAAWNNEGNVLYLASSSAVHVVDSESWMEAHKVDIPGYVHDLCTLASGGVVVAAYSSSDLTPPGGVFVLKCSNQRPFLNGTAPLKLVDNEGCLSVAAASSTIIACVGDRVMVWTDQEEAEDAHSWHRYNGIDISVDSSAHVAISDDGIIITVYDESGVRFYQKDSFGYPQLHSIPSTREFDLYQESVSLSPSGRMCAYSTTRGIKVVDIESLETRLKIRGGVTPIAFLSESRVLVAYPGGVSVYAIAERKNS